MGKIDDPLDRIAFVNRERPEHGLTHLLSLSAPVISLLDPTIAAFTTIGAFLKAAGGQQSLESRAEAFRAGIIDEIRELVGRVEVIEMKTADPAAHDAFASAMRAALATARLDKARVFGHILGGTLKQDCPKCQEAAEFIRDVEQFSDDDVLALQILWNVQRTVNEAMQQKSSAAMSTKANDYTGTWSGVMDHVTRASISPDDWASRCARLMGFGLALTVPSNKTQQNSDTVVFRLTGRGVRLLDLIGRNVDPRAYPSMRYNAAGKTRTVDDEEQDRALGAGWADTPAAFQKAPFNE